MEKFKKPFDKSQSLIKRKRGIPNQRGMPRRMLPGMFPAGYTQASSNRSRFMTLFQAAAKSCRNFSWASLLA
jgi:hypothetical protein